MTKSSKKSKEKSSKTDELRAIRDEVVGLKESPLYSYRINNNYYPVIGEGSHDASIMFIGEAPGKNEALKARPFCGAAGKILDELLESIRVARADVYITNIVKDRPPENRDPTPDEISVYAPFLDRQIDIIQPKVIATLGRYSMSYILDKFDVWEASNSISQNHGHIFEANTSYGKIKIIPLYHPAAAIYNRASLDTHKKDFQVLKQFI